jgi:hypothetical protein
MEPVAPRQAVHDDNQSAEGEPQSRENVWMTSDDKRLTFQRLLRYNSQ